MPPKINGMPGSIGTTAPAKPKRIKAPASTLSARSVTIASVAAAGDGTARIQQQFSRGAGAREDHETGAVRVLHAGDEHGVVSEVVPRIRTELRHQIEDPRRLETGIGDTHGLIGRAD